MIFAPPAGDRFCSRHLMGAVAALAILVIGCARARPATAPEAKPPRSDARTDGFLAASIADGGTGAGAVTDAGQPDGLPQPSPMRPSVVPPPAPLLRERMRGAAQVRVEEHEVLDDGRHRVRTWLLRDEAAVSALLAAVGLDQRPGGGCTRCSPLLRLFVMDRLGTNLGFLGLDCPRPLGAADTEATDAGVEARFEGGSGEDCRVVRVRDPDGLRAVLAAGRFAPERPGRDGGAADMRSAR